MIDYLEVYVLLNFDLILKLNILVVKVDYFIRIFLNFIFIVYNYICFIEEII